MLNNIVDNIEQCCPNHVVASGFQQLLIFDHVIEKLNFPGGYLPEGEMWFSEYLRRLIGAILVQSRGSSGLIPTITFSACALSSSDGVQAEVL